MQVTTSNPSCPVCGGQPSAPLTSLERVPATCNALWPNEREAREAPLGDIELVACADCGFVWNAAFHPELVDYSQRYENCLAFSRVFADYSQELARWLVDRHDLRGKRILEVGAGSGEFLALLCALGGNRGIGFDPSYDLDQADRPPDLEIIADEFPPSRPTTADFVVCRHVLEHIDVPGTVLEAVVRSVHAPPGRRVRAYVEVPNAAYMFTRGMVWDVIYEHCGYFSPPNLQLLVERAGSSVLGLGASYGGQYLWVELEVGDQAGSSGAPTGAEEVVAGAIAFGAAFDATIARWTERVHDLSDGGEVVAWGAGSKGVMFCNLVGAGRIARIVDASPRKHGLFVPGSAQEVIPPDALVELRPRHVVVMNPLYVEEIRSTLAGLGLECNVIAADSDETRGALTSLA